MLLFLGLNFIRKLVDLSKIYTKDIKYSSNEYNIFDPKVRIFIDLYNRLEILGDKGAIIAFPIILTSKVKEYFYKK